MNIWNDVWLPSPGDGRVKSQNIDLRYLTVADLIDSESVTWEKEVINRLFSDEQAERILSISLVSSNLKSRRLKEDALCPICKEEEEIVAHLFRDCAFTKPILQEAVIFTEDLDFREVCAEGDALTVRKKLRIRLVHCNEIEL
ncbi:hypothetical protein Gogos_021534 [Gossypium gossypioides]|uniref:Reverse transcriptase zinc-binding domain-containing protein n=1 Tax=Gossypium gossypioides TaxID=34282 RepID=A0A7J9CX61_GOSGO|nr:hypothetical protein [Gossypium gossypioides]